ncbi:MAG: DUF6804 family protein [Bacteroidota bacterium]
MFYAILFFLCLVDMPYCFYQFVRFAVKVHPKIRLVKSWQKS